MYKSRGWMVWHTKPHPLLRRVLKIRPRLISKPFVDTLKLFSQVYLCGVVTLHLIQQSHNPLWHRPSLYGSIRQLLFPLPTSARKASLRWVHSDQRTTAGEVTWACPGPVLQSMAAPRISKSHGTALLKKQNKRGQRLLSPNLLQIRQPIEMNSLPYRQRGHTHGCKLRLKVCLFLLFFFIINTLATGAQFFFFEPASQPTISVSSLG